ncbi:MAG: tRNA (adenosine(37)-N6)-dimethylallyltransferase MiaA [SAR202 cluster bacterium]|nr:tRNA (adenosine(37)-N6)-dimethylallyltransferase MiaA [SAR202 cluster bacterium]
MCALLNDYKFSIVIVGPTAAGKSGLGLWLAQTLDGEIINADSRQVYRGMDIGTAKATAQERALVPHHLLDLCDPDEDFSLARFLELARNAIEDVQERRRLPIIVGGTGQYVWALLEGWRPPTVPPNSTLRADLELQLKQRGVWALYQLLSAVDPEAAQRTDPKNPRRVIRALEVHLTSKGQAVRPKKTALAQDVLILGLTMPRKELYRRIDERLDGMMAQGFLEEVRRIVEAGYSPSLPSMSSAGYKELAAHLAGKLSLDEAVQRAKYRTHQIARRQYNWFRLDDPRIRWLEADGAEFDKALAIVHDFVANYDKIPAAGRSEAHESD